MFRRKNSLGCNDVKQLSNDVSTGENTEITRFVYLLSTLCQEAVVNILFSLCFKTSFE